MVDQFRAEEGFGSELLDFFAVFGVIGDGTRTRLRKARDGKQTQRQQQAGQISNH
jgi:hypothetical protein